MTFSLGAKSTKPGSKAAARANRSGDGSSRVPVGTLHYIDPANQSSASSMFDAVCGEPHLVAVDGEWDESLPNDLCAVCADAEWQVQFNEMQTKLLK